MGLSELIGMFPPEREVVLGDKKYPVRPMSVRGVARLNHEFANYPRETEVAKTKRIVSAADINGDLAREMILEAARRDDAWPTEIVDAQIGHLNCFVSDPDMAEKFVAEALGVEKREAAGIVDSATTSQLKMLLVVSLWPVNEVVMIQHLGQAAALAKAAERWDTLKKITEAMESLAKPDEREDPTPAGATASAVASGAGESGASVPST